MQLPRLVHLLHRLLHQRVDVRAGQRRVLEQGEKARERRAQLVRDRCGEAHAELLVRREFRRRAAKEDEQLGMLGDGLLVEPRAESPLPAASCGHSG